MTDKRALFATVLPALLALALFTAAAEVSAHEPLQSGLMPYSFWTDPQPDDISHIPTGMKLSFEGLTDMLSGARVVYIGEAHTNLHAHRVQFEIGHWLRKGLRVSFGYSYDKYDDRTQAPIGVGSADPFDPSTHVNTFMFGVTMNSDLLR